MKKKCIVHLISELDVGGTEKQLLLLIPALQAKFDNHVICMMGKGQIGAALQARGIPVSYLEGRHRLDPRIPLRLFTILRKQRPTALITYLIFADIVGRVVGRIARVPVIIESQRSSLYGPRLRHYVDRATRWLVTHYTAQTQHAKRLLIQVVGVRPEHITVIPNAVAPPAGSSSATTRSQHNIPAESIVIISVANLKPEKGLDVLLQAFFHLHQKFPTAHLWLVGEGPQRHELEQMAHHSTAHTNIHFLGLRDDVPGLLAASDIFVLPTTIEGMSNALLEALATGVACVASDIPANREVITSGEHGLLYRTNDAADLSTKLAQLAADPAVRQRIGHAAASYAAANHSVDFIAYQWGALLSHLT